MTDVHFRFDVVAPAERVLDAVRTTEGIKGVWTSDADVPDEVGGTLRLGFPVAPMPFDLQLDRSDERTVAWTTESFPPDWVGTTIQWDVGDRGGGATVTFCHAGFTEAGDAGSAAYTWGQILVQLKRYAETGTPDPVFA